MGVSKATKYIKRRKGVWLTNEITQQHELDVMYKRMLLPEMVPKVNDSGADGSAWTRCNVCEVESACCKCRLTIQEEKGLPLK